MQVSQLKFIYSEKTDKSFKNKSYQRLFQKKAVTHLLLYTVYDFFETDVSNLKRILGDFFCVDFSENMN